MRVATVWMDEYKQYLIKRRPQYGKIDPGDLTEQLAVRKRLECKPFKWFMENVAFDLPKKYPPIEPPDFAFGEIRSIAIPDHCVDTHNRNKDERVVLEPCVKDIPKRPDNSEQVSEQLFFKMLESILFQLNAV
jgi:polypeptide N-acetylgalactosaminyltransferase